MLVVVAAMIATVVLILRRPVRFLAIVQGILAGLVIIAFVVGMKMASWLHSMAYADPVRQEWQPKLDKIGSILWFGTLIPWLLFTIYHVFIVVRRKPSA